MFEINTVTEKAWGSGRVLMFMEGEFEKGYRELAADLDAEAEALEWIEGTIGDLIEQG